jgi:uncharacterized protein
MKSARRLLVILALAAIGCHRADADDEADPPEDPDNPYVEPPALHPALLDPCEHSSAEECARLADLRMSDEHITKGTGAPLNPKRAMEIYESACILGSARACAVAGDGWYHYGHHMGNPNTNAHTIYCEGQDDVRCELGEDDLRATALYERGCDLGSAHACAVAGELRDLGYEAMRRDPRRAAALLRRACDGGDSEGCFHLGGIVRGSRAGPPDRPAALALYEKACALGYLDGCDSAAYMFDRGDGVPEDPVRAVALYQSLCDTLQGWACIQLADHFVQGRGTAKDPARAAPLYERDCQRGFDEVGRSCYELGRLYQRGEGVPRDRAEARRLFERACDKRDESACWMLRWFGP